MTLATLYTYAPYHDHYVVVRLSDSRIMCHCDSVRECREEIALLTVY